MILRCRGRPALRQDEPGTIRSAIMKWETPTAVDFRFGMEITMYIANR